MARSKKSNRAVSITLTALSLLFLFYAGYLIQKNLYNPAINRSSEQKTTAEALPEPEATNPPQENSYPKQEDLPDEIKLSVPFTPQAPTANWDKLHDEACEEASSIIANAYFSGITELPPTFVEQEIDKLTKWQIENFGYSFSTTTEETAQMISEVYKLHTEIVPISLDTIKTALSENKLIILPAQGQKLQNPNFKAPGPIYHMLVITGYTKDNIITNDPGTRKGKNYLYKYDTLYNASGSWNQKLQDVDTTVKNIIIVSK